MDPAVFEQARRNLLLTHASRLNDDLHAFVGA